MSPAAPYLVSATVLLPCGHKLEKTAAVESHRATWIQECAELLAWWIKSRTDGHKCALVTEQNPSGYGGIAPTPTTDPGVPG